jgi:chemotaxis protein CheD
VSAGRAPLPVGLGRIVTSGDADDVLTATGLGSCVGVVMADPARRVAGMAHVMLPEAPAGSPAAADGRYADRAVPALRDRLVALGARRRSLVATIAGGARMFGSGSGAGGLDVGRRNDAAVRAALGRAGVGLRAADTGGDRGRTLSVAVADGVVSVRPVGGRAARL